MKKMRDEHNRRIDGYAYSIDKKIYELINLTDSEIRTVELCLRENNFYVPQQ
jgi:hypothetical protein